ncbi:MAG: hypothetical protein ACE5GE_17140, partial [Phycisphaerae bacterium]
KMEHETPVLMLQEGWYRKKRGARNHEIWLCPEFVGHYFGIRPRQISLTIANRHSKECVPVEVWRNSRGGIRWAPVDLPPPAKYFWGILALALERFAVDRLKPTRMKRRWYVTVWIYD